MITDQLKWMGLLHFACVWLYLRIQGIEPATFWAQTCFFNLTEEIHFSTMTRRHKKISNKTIWIIRDKYDNSHNFSFRMKVNISISWINTVIEIKCINKTAHREKKQTNRKEYFRMNDRILSFYFHTVMATVQSLRHGGGLIINSHHYNRTIRLERNYTNILSTAKGNVLKYDRRQKKSL